MGDDVARPVAGALHGGRRRRRMPGRVGRLLWPAAGAGALGWAAVAGWPELRAAGGVLRDAAPGRLLLALGCQVAALFLLAVAYQAALATAGARLALRGAGGVALRAATVSRLLPGGGPAAALFAVQRLRRAGIPRGSALGGVVLHGVLTMSTLVVLVAVAAVAGGAAGATTARAAVAVLAAVALACAAVGFLARRRLPVLVAALRRRPSLAVWASAVGTLAGSPLRRGPLATAAACAAGAWAFELIGLWLAVSAMGAPLPLAAVALGLGAANAVTAVPHTPGGVGVVEVAMTAAFVAAGLDTAAALGGVLAYRAVGFWFPVAVGGTLLLGDGLAARHAWRRETSAVAG